MKDISGIEYIGKKIDQFGYIDKDYNFHVTNKPLFHNHVKNIDEFKNEQKIKNIIYEKISHDFRESYHMGGGGHGRM